MGTTHESGTGTTNRAGEAPEQVADPTATEGETTVTEEGTELERSIGLVGGIAIGTLFGSNITDPLFSFGVGAMVGGFTFTNVSVVLASAAYMLVASTLVVALFFFRGEVDQRGAIGCIGLYLPMFFV